MFAILLGLTLILAGCGGTSASQSVGPTQVKCQAALTGLPDSIAASGARLNATLSTNRDCLWEVTTDSAWLQVSPGRGQGEAALRVSVAENTSAAIRSGSIAVNDTRVSVRQQAAPCRFALNTSSAEVLSQGGPIDVSVSATSGCPWTASSAVAWVHGVRTSGKGNGTAQFSVDPNSGVERSTTLTVAGRTVSVRQAAAGSAPAAFPPPTPSPSPTPAPTTEHASFKGRVSKLTGACPTLSFAIDRRSVITDAATRFTKGKCRDMKNGIDVAIDGDVLANGLVLATKIELKGK